MIWLIFEAIIAFIRSLKFQKQIKS